MKWRRGFKYQLAEALYLQTDIYPVKDLISDFVILRTNGGLELLKGFAWDGVSGPVIDRKTNHKGGAGHDGLYRLMRKGFLPSSKWRHADLMYAQWLRDAGAWSITIKIDMLGLKWANGYAADPRNKSTVYEL